MKKTVVGCMLVVLLVLLGFPQKVEGQSNSVDSEDKLSVALSQEVSIKEDSELLEIAVQLQTSEGYDNAVLALQDEFQSYIGSSLTTNHQLHKQYLDELEKVTKYYWNNQFSIYFNNSRVEYVSKYTPFVFLSATRDEIYELSLNPNIKYISEHFTRGANLDIGDMNVCNAYNNSVCTPMPAEDYLGLSEIEEAKSFYNVTGQGVNIGILGQDYCIDPHYSEIDTDRLVFSDYCPDLLISNEHDEAVAIIAAGETSGVANDATIYNSAYRETYTNGSPLTREQALEALAYVTDVINISFTTLTNDGIYDSDSQFFDYIIRYTYVPIVVSSGNFKPLLNPNRYVTSISTATNVISVGSMDIYDNNIANYSCYGTVSGVIRPDILAAGGDGYYASVYETGDEDGDGYYYEELDYYYVFDVPSLGADRLVYGTSFASPIVTGTIALMLELNPYLAYHPYEIKSILMSSADTSNINSTFYSSTGLSTTAGAGKLNAMNALFVVDNQVSFGSITSTTNSNVVIKQLYTYVGAGTTLKVAFSPLRNQQESTNVGVSYYNIYIDRWNGSDFVTIAHTYGTTTESKRISFYIASSQTYRIRLVLTTNNDTTHTQFGGLSVYNTLEANLIFSSNFIPGC